MKIKNTQIVIFILMSINLVFINEIKSQYSIAGTHGAIYVDIIPDTLINPPHIPYSGGDAYYYIDINQDGINDIELDASDYHGLGNVFMWVNISSLNSFTSFSLGSIDSTNWNINNCTSGWRVRNIFKIYYNGDTIKNGNYMSSGYLGFYHVTPCNIPAYSPEWENKSDVFFGVKYQTVSDTFYGWVKVSVPADDQVLIKEFSLGSPLSGINSLDVNNFITVYPNPASVIIHAVLNIQNALQTTALQITDLLGNVIKQENLTTKKITIDASDLQNGIYFMQIKTSEGFLTKKIIIQR